ncbi:hypothetical protein VFPPC_18186 [Pochonia chlamydosporia 170]|uniref:Uncharacterized protein n=1 Tax=Pochonia chlamydosporia 170 TaxID=1380566 RepID=A0A219AN76_METCM|nr:hypothetical protein VFPPC_18186 [Pochonia chlamydosporia 170]OWT42300.1 hypothetical protein VFPPC_18186 [Pochonia chlamydosporia 170]
MQLLGNDDSNVAAVLWFEVVPGLRERLDRSQTQNEAPSSLPTSSEQKDSASTSCRHSLTRHQRHVDTTSIPLCLLVSAGPSDDSPNPLAAAIPSWQPLYPLEEEL